MMPRCRARPVAHASRSRCAPPRRASCCAVRNASPIRAIRAARRDADDADMIGSPGARGIRVAQSREVERGDFVEVLAPAVEDIAALAGRGGLAADDVDAIDAGHGEHPAVLAAAQADLVLVPRFAGHVELAAMPMYGQHLAARAGVDRDVEGCLRFGPARAGTGGTCRPVRTGLRATARSAAPAIWKASPASAARAASRRARNPRSGTSRHS